MLAIKKHSKDKSSNGAGTSSAENVDEPPAPAKNENVEKSIVKVQSKTHDPGGSAKHTTVPPSPKAKSSRASKIKKIMKEVTKKRGRHKRSKTGPESPGSTDNDEQIHQKSEFGDGGASELSEKGSTRSKIHVEEAEDRGGEEGGVVEKDKEPENLPLNQLSMLLHEMPSDATNQQISDEKKVEKNASFRQSSKDYYDVINVLSFNKRFFLRVLDDPDSSLRENFITQHSAPSTSTRKPLSKFGTFPATRSSSVIGEGSSPKCKHSSFKVRYSRNQTLSEKPRSSLDSQMLGTRFKSFRQRIDQVAKESREESRRIAMDAVFHKVPVGENGQEESGTRSSPRVGSGESNFSYHKNGRKIFKSSPSFEASMDQYCQLFETTSSFNRSSRKMETREKTRLKVKDENSSEKVLKRNFSLPDLEVSVYQQQSHDYGRCSSFRAPASLLSFNERRAHEGALNTGLELGTKTGDGAGVGPRKEPKEQVNSEAIPIEPKELETVLNALEDASSDDSMMDSQFHEIMSLDSTPIMLDEYDDKALSGIDELQLEDGESTKEFEDSPTFACIKVDEDQVEWLIEPPLLRPSLEPFKVSSKDEAEYNYVRDILQLSGYSGSQLLGSWDSSGQPVDPSVFLELESCSLMEPTGYLSSKEGNGDGNHMLLFDLINEVLMSIYERSISYWPRSLCWCSRTHQMPKGYRVLEEVWSCINWYLACSREGLSSNFDNIVGRDLAKDDGWRNLQFDAECIGIEVEDVIFDDLLTELAEY